MIETLLLKIQFIITTTLNYINEITNGNEMMAGFISAGVMGYVGYICRGIPRKIWAFFLKHTTTEMTTTSSHKAFFDICKWLVKKGYDKRFRKLKISNGRYGDGNKTIKSIGYGNHIIWYKWKPIKISFREKEANQTENDRDAMTLSKFGRSHKVFDELIEEASKRDKKIKETCVYEARYSGWQHLGSQKKRPLESVVIQQDKMDKILNTIDKFQSKEEWYLKHGIPWQIGILLHGPPGTGKTSFVKALASYLEYDLYITPASTLLYNLDCIKDVRTKSIVVIEDIDSSNAAVARVKKNNYTNLASAKIVNEIDKIPDAINRKGSTPPAKFAKTERRQVVQSNKSFSSQLRDATGLATARKDPYLENKDLDEKKSYGTSDLLNAIDGTITTHGRIIVMTTNYPEKLDEALMRPGRVDLKVEIGYFDEECFVRFLKRFFPELNDDYFKNISLVRDNITGAELQQKILEGYNADQLMELYAERQTQSMGLIGK